MPAYFSDPQRKATLDAARLAGLAVERLVNEPTAAALAHGLDSIEEGRFLILDLGGGTFDVSLLHKFEGVMEVRASAGDSLSAATISATRWSALIARRHDVDPDRLARADLARLMREAERIKHALTTQDSAGYESSRATKRARGRWRRAEFEEASQPLLRRLRAPIERAVADARVDPQSIDQIILVGGATHMPMARALVARLFRRFPLAHPRPDHVVALGAAVAGGPEGAPRRARRPGDDRRLPVHARHFGARPDCARPAHDVAADRAQRRRADQPLRRYFTVDDNQAAIVIEVFQGENLRPAQNIKIGELRMPVPLAPAGREGSRSASLTTSTARWRSRSPPRPPASASAACSATRPISAPRRSTSASARSPNSRRRRATRRKTAR